MTIFITITLLNSNVFPFYDRCKSEALFADLYVILHRKMFVKPKFLPNSHVLLHLQLCVRPLWTADRPEPEYQQIQSRGELAT